MRRLHLPIQDPCHENWDAMNLEGEGRRFCDVCTKHVHDLSVMTERKARAVIADWHASLRPRLLEQNLAYTDADLEAMSDAELADHLDELTGEPRNRRPRKVAAAPEFAHADGSAVGCHQLEQVKRPLDARRRHR